MKNFDHQSGNHLAVDGANIYYEVIGDDSSPTLLVLHGGFGTLEDFNTIFPYLDKAFRVIGIDSRGHGKSTFGKQMLSYERLQKDVERVLKHLSIDKVSIIGFSDGGTVAYRLGSLTPLNIDKLVTIGSHWHLKNTEATRELFLKITGKSWREKFPDMYNTHQKLNPEPDFNLLAQSLINMWLDPGSSGYPNEAVANISCPLHIVRGDDDHLLSKEAIVELSGLVEHSSLFNIPNAGHAAFEDQTESFMLDLNAFFAE